MTIGKRFCLKVEYFRRNLIRKYTGFTHGVLLVFNYCCDKISTLASS